MKDKQNQFYTSISEYYSEIFPYQPLQLQFVKTRVGELTGKQILDIGCATGELAFQMAKENAEVVGIDLNEDLLQQAKLNKVYPSLQFQMGNMLNLETDFIPGQFNAVLCFGNTLVHLKTPELVQKMLKGVYSILKAGGQFMMQILNYDYILSENVTELPLIESENIRFVRKYEVKKNNRLISFQTELIVKKEKEIISNKTTLLALQSSELKELLYNVGFKEIELFSNFKQDTFGGKHLPLVVTCNK